MILMKRAINLALMKKKLIIMKNSRRVQKVRRNTHYLQDLALKKTEAQDQAQAHQDPALVQVLD